MKKTILLLIMSLFSVASAYAVPVLQVGVPDGSGGWVANTDLLTNPTEDDTVVTSGTTISFAGLYKDADVLNLGGQYSTGKNWSDFGLPTEFNNTTGAIVLVSVPEGRGDYAFANFKIDGNLAFYSDADNSYFPNDHAPVKSAISDFLFFDIGNFLKNNDAVVNFQPELGEVLEYFDGEIKSLEISQMGDLAWIHFDLMALQTSQSTIGNPLNNNVEILTNDFYNPGSHDVTWKPDGTVGPVGVPDPVPEPGTFILFGAGLVGLGLLKIRHGKD